MTNLAAYYDRAVAALRTANYNQVLVELDPVLSETPEDGDTWMVRAQALFALGTYGKAASSLHTALRLLPNAEWGRPVVRVRDYFASEAEFAVRLRRWKRMCAIIRAKGPAIFCSAITTAIAATRRWPSASCAPRCGW